MAVQGSLLRGCASIRGVSDVPHIRSIGGLLAKEANRLYMLTVRRESLLNKRRSLEVRLKEIQDQLREIEEDVRETQRKYKLTKRQSSERGKGSSKHEDGRAVRTRTMPLSF